MPPLLERAFEFLFKYRPLVFEKGRLALLTPWPPALVIAVMALLLAPLVLSYRGARGKARLLDRAALVLLRAAALSLLLLSLLRPALLVTTVAPQQSFVGVLVDDSQSLGIADVGGRPRSAFVSEQLGQDGSALRRALEARFRLRFFRFAGGSERVRRVSELGFDGTATDLTAALRHAQQELGSVPLSGLVLVSDGADNAGGPLSETLLSLRARGIPVFTVGLGRERFGRDVEVTRVEAPSAVLLGTSLVTHVTLEARGLRRARAQLLVEDGGRVVHREEVLLPAEGEARNLRVHVTAGEPGPRLYRFRIAALEGEQVTQNNARDVLVQVADRREKVLYVEGETRFEPKFLRRAVADDRNLRLATLQRTSKNKFLRLDVDDAEELAAGFPKARAELFAYKGLVLGSVEASFFSGDQLRMLSDFVGQRGGGLLMLGGARSFGEGGYADTPLADALPVVVLAPANAGERAGEARPLFASLRVEPTPFGATHAITQLAPTEEESAERWRRLPALSSTNDVRRVKPGAAALLVGMPEGSGAAQVVLASQRFGRGKALAFTVQDSWLFQMHAEIPVEDQTHENLWRQLLRYVVSGVPGPVVATASGEIVAPGTSVTLRAEVSDELFLRVNNAQVLAVVKDPSGDVHEQRLEWTVEKDGEYRGHFVAAQRGAYEIRVEAERAGKPLGQDVVHLRADDRPVEFHGAEMKAAALRRIASETGGRFYTPETVGALPEELSYSEGGATVTEQKELWDMPALFIGVLGLVSAEWVWRKARALA